MNGPTVSIGPDGAGDSGKGSRPPDSTSSARVGIPIRDLDIRNDTLSPGTISEGTVDRVSTGIQMIPSFSPSLSSSGGVLRSWRKTNDPPTTGREARKPRTLSTAAQR